MTASLVFSPHSASAGAVRFDERPAALLPDGSYDIGQPTVAALLAEPHDYVVMVDYSQNNARGEHKAATTEALNKIVAMAHAGGSKTIVLMPSPAYRAPAKGSETIGSWAEFYTRQGAGCESL